MFTGRGGKPLSPRSAARWIAEGIAKAGLQEAATGTGVKGPASHSLRHSCARHWLQSGLNVNAVSDWLGHSRPTVPSTPTWCWLRTLWGTYPRFHNKRCAKREKERPDPARRFGLYRYAALRADQRVQLVQE